jgi:translocation and assembly module TamA
MTRSRHLADRDRAPAPVRVLLRASLAVPLVTAAAGVTPGSAQEGLAPEAGQDRTEVTAIEFPGAVSLDRDVLLSAIATEATRCGSPLFAPVCLVADFDWAHRRGYVDPGEVARDRRRLELLYEGWGYPRVSVTAVYDSTAPATAVRFRVDEGEPLVVRSIELRGLDAVDPPIEPPDRLPLRPGDPYALPRLAMIEDWLKDRMSERGHPFGEVSVTGEVDETTSSARLVLEPEPGPTAVFGPPRIDAGPPITEETVSEILRFRPGQPYSLTELRESEIALYRLPIVQRAIIQPAVSSPPATDSVAVTVDVAVFPRRVRGFEVEGTLSSTECLTAAVFWRHRYFMGGPRLFTVGAGTTHLLADPLDGAFPCTSAGTGPFARPQYFAQADLRQPWPGHPETQLHLGLAAYRSAAPEVYIQDGVRATAAVARAFNGGLTGMIRYSPARNQLDASLPYYCGTYGICDAATVGTLEQASWLAPLELTGSWTPAGEPRQTVPPEELERLSLWGPPGGRYWASADYRYLRGLAEISITRPVGLTSEVAGHLRGGWIDGAGSLPPQVRLYAGGLYSVRGLAENMLGPTTLITDAATAIDLGCDAACPPGLVIGPDHVSTRPTGGNTVLEGSLEGRWWATESIQLAAFVDVGALRRDRLDIEGGLALDDGWSTAVTPGVGLRVLSNLGPIRLDLGYDLSGPRERPLFAASDDALEFLGRVRFDPFGHDDPGFLTELVRRLQVHVGLGQPF